MGYKSIVTKIDELRTIVSSWSDGSEPASLEMDMALDRVKSIYEMLRFPVAEEQPVEQPAEEQIEEIEEAGVEIEQEQEESIEIVVEDEPIEEVAEDEPIEVNEPEPEEIHIELVNVTPIATEESLSEDESEMDHKRQRMKKILSLYEEAASEIDAMVSESEGESEEATDKTAEATTEEEITTAPIEVEIEVKVECVSESEAEVECETEVEVKEECAFEGDSIVDILSLNDRLLLSYELFSGDEAQLIEALKALDRQPSLDDAILYIAEHYSWSGDNEGAQLLMTLLQNRYQS